MKLLLKNSFLNLIFEGVLLLISSIFYYFTMFTDPGYVPKKVVFENTHYK